MDCDLHNLSTHVVNCGRCTLGHTFTAPFPLACKSRLESTFFKSSASEGCARPIAARLAGGRVTSCNCLLVITE